ncbi:bridge-like lipid transfer protein family member 3A isoform X2 [Hoplias malabaricus]|uniref:bridge-like lipid transfer protein family member 3A isoform X2 n=1 Tax=Hoplias malabaricus TaxID=27720 RepID=UPI003461C91A
MAGIIKKQILKHLSRFTKNLSPDKINLSTLKGEGQLSNLELDEEVLQNMLDLPTWLAVTRVYCNKAAIRIQWTKLKTSPICLFLDKVEVEMRTCEEPRPPNGPSPIAITAGQSEYGFAEKVVEGMSVVINSIIIKLQSRAFHASFELWQLQGFSLNPNWQRTDLRYTRITHPKRGEVLTFKEINWQSLRIEADAIESEDQDLGNTPLRLITNQGRIRIALKRRVKDCNVLASKLLFILDDLLWVLTDSQLKAVIHYAKSLSEAMEKSAQQRKSLAVESLQTAPPSPGPHTLWAEPPPAPTGTASTLAQYFDLHDVKETSYHTFISRLDLHICNDSSSADSDEPPPPGSQGAIQLTFRKLGCDYYPFHRPGDGCRHWECYCGAMESQAQWVAKLLQEFQHRVESSGFPGPQTDIHTPSTQSPARKTHGEGGSTPKSTPDGAAAPGSALKRLRSSCMVIRVHDLDIHQVSTGRRNSKRTQSLLFCNRKSLQLSENTAAIHLQFTEYYFPHGTGTPVPCSNLYAQLNGLQLCVDAPSLLWMALFSRGLLRTLEQVKAFYHLQDSSKSEEHVDIRVDTTQLQVVVPLDSSILDHMDRPQSLCVVLPQSVLSNTRHCPHGSLSDLQSVFSSFSSRTFFQLSPNPTFPRDRNTFHPLPPGFLHPSSPERRQTRAEDLWCLSLSRAALSFEGAKRGPRGRTFPFVEPFALSVWMCRPNALGQNSRTKKGRDIYASRSRENSEELFQPETNHENIVPEPPSAPIHVLVQSITPVKLWLNHYQYIALLRMKDYLSQLASDLTRDPHDSHLLEQKIPDLPAVCVSVLLEAMDLALLLPPAVHEPDEDAVSPEETDSPSLTDSETSPSHRAGITERRQDATNNGEGMNNQEEGKDNSEDGGEGEGEGSVEEACEAVEVDDRMDLIGQNAEAPPSPALTRDTSTFSLEGELSSALNATRDATKDALSASLDLTKGALSITKDAFSILSRGSAVSKLFSAPKEQGARPEDPGLRLQPLKHSPSQNSWDSGLLDGSLAEDGLSVDSDTSDNFIILMDSESGLESLRPNGSAGNRGGSAAETEGGSSAEISSSQSTEDLQQDTVSVCD